MLLVDRALDRVAAGRRGRSRKEPCSSVRCCEPWKTVVRQNQKETIVNGNPLRVAPPSPDQDEGVVTWSSMRHRVQRYLESQGMPALQAERFSHEIVVTCARDVDGADSERMGQRVIDEADTVLVGWQAARRLSLPTAA
jgi:hypothetical protein